MDQTTHLVMGVTDKAVALVMVGQAEAMVDPTVEMVDQAEAILDQTVEMVDQTVEMEVTSLGMGLGKGTRQ